MEEVAARAPSSPNVGSPSEFQVSNANKQQLKNEMDLDPYVLPMFWRKGVNSGETSCCGLAHAVRLNAVNPTTLRITHLKYDHDLYLNY